MLGQAFSGNVIWSCITLRQAGMWGGGWYVWMIYSCSNMNEGGTRIVVDVVNNICCWSSDEKGVRRDGLVTSDRSRFS